MRKKRTKWKIEPDRRHDRKNIRKTKRLGKLWLAMEYKRKICGMDLIFNKNEIILVCRTTC